MAKADLQKILPGATVIINKKVKEIFVDDPDDSSSGSDMEAHKHKHNKYKFGDITRNILKKQKEKHEKKKHEKEEKLQIKNYE